MRARKLKWGMYRLFSGSGRPQERTGGWCGFSARSLCFSPRVSARPVFVFVEFHEFPLLSASPVRVSPLAKWCPVLLVAVRSWVAAPEPQQSGSSLLRLPV